MSLKDDIEKLQAHWKRIRQGEKGLAFEAHSEEFPLRLEAKNMITFLQELDKYIEGLTEVVGKIAEKVESTED